jgi:hypothetical protein
MITNKEALVNSASVSSLVKFKGISHDGAGGGGGWGVRGINWKYPHISFWWISVRVKPLLARSISLDNKNLSCLQVWLQMVGKYLIGKNKNLPGPGLHFLYDLVQPGFSQLEQL